jgi:hypothetical protein
MELMKMVEKVEEKGFVRVCENLWHGEVKLNKFKEYPKCFSTSYHWLIVKT